VTPGVLNILKYTSRLLLMAMLMLAIIITTDRRGNTRRQKCYAKGSGKEVKIQEFSYRDTMNVELERYDYASNNWSHWNSNEKLKEKFGSCIRRTLDRFTTKTAIIGILHIIRKVLQCEA